MRRRKTEPMRVTSFRLPEDVHLFLKERAAVEDRTMSYILVNVLKQYMHYISEQAKQPKATKK